MPVPRIVPILLLVVPMLAYGQPGDAPAPVRVAEAREMMMTTTILVPGTVVSRNDARIAAEVAGRLTMVADVGTAVAAGDVVARVEDTPLQLRVAELKAQVAREQARLRFLSREEERLASLAERNVAARNQLDETRSDRDVAANELAVARARFAQLEDQLQRTALRAPWDGTVVERLSRQGEHVTAGTVVARLVAPARLEVVTRGPLDVIGFIAPGDAVQLRAGATPLVGTVRTVVAVGDENTHLFEARIDLEGAAAPVGQPARVTLPASSPRTVLAVPRDALVLRPEGIAVFVVEAEGTARRVSVETGLAMGEFIEIVGDLAAGDRVIIRGNERLRPGQKVSILRSGGSAAGG
ncbi:MAG: efflux RND transporter periplasmic adaptor subunit [Pseudomonadota bacterium]